MTVSMVGRLLAAATALLAAVCSAASAGAQTSWAQDISVSNVVAPPTQRSADIAHVSLVISNVGKESDVLIAVEVPPQIAEAAGFYALPLTVYRGAKLRLSQPVFIKAGETRHMGFEDTHLLIYGIRGPFTRGFRFPVRLVFQKAGPIDVIATVGSSLDQTVAVETPSRRPKLIDVQYREPKPARRMFSEPSTGSAFRCEDGSKMVLDLNVDGDSAAADVWVGGASYRLAHVPPEPGPVQIVWSDGDHSLTWSPGVKLMWMSDSTHLMCGRGGHSH
jgi:copper(I)-binding protein